MRTLEFQTGQLVSKTFYVNFKALSIITRIETGRRLVKTLGNGEIKKSYWKTFRGTKSH